MAKGRKVNLPRQESKVTDRQERFALEYAIDFDRLRALKAAGYTPKDYDNAHSMAAQLLKNPKVNAIVLEAKARYAEALKLDAAKTVMCLQVVYMEAMAHKDWHAAVAALRELGKHHGIYEKHQKQKSYTQDDVERLKKELEQAGFDFRRVNDVTQPSNN